MSLLRMLVCIACASVMQVYAQQDTLDDCQSYVLFNSTGEKICLSSGTEVAKVMVENVPPIGEEAPVSEESDEFSNTQVLPDEELLPEEIEGSEEAHLINEDVLAVEQ